MFHRLGISVCLAALVSTAVPVFAQDAYDKFYGDYVAAIIVANGCDGVSAMDQQAAATVARDQNGLRKQKVLKVLFYGKRDFLMKLGNATLASRNVNAGNAKALCGFGKSIAGKNDSVGRFLSKS